MWLHPSHPHTCQDYLLHVVHCNAICRVRGRWSVTATDMKQTLLETRMHPHAHWQHAHRLQSSPVIARRLQSPRAAAKELWVQTENKACLTAGLESGISTFVVDSAEQREAFKRLARFNMLCRGDSTISTSSGSSAGATPYSLVDEEGKEAAVVYPISGPADLKSLEARAANQPGSLGRVAVMDSTAWQVIPAENLVALLHDAPAGCRLFAVAHTPDEVDVMLGVLEVGTAGVLLRTDSPAVVREAAEVVARCNAAMQGTKVPLVSATVTRVTPVGMAERVCVDTTSILGPHEGLLCGNFARGLMLVTSEAQESQYISSRPFRVNAGAVHTYVLQPGGRTAYLSELRAGSQVQVVSSTDGSTRAATVGRCKIERRPMVMVEAQLSDGSMVSCMLQNAETVKVAGKLSSSSAAEAHHEQSQPSSHNVQHMALHGSHAISVAVLQPGDQILVHVPKEAARHTGISVKEFVKEV